MTSFGLALERARLVMLKSVSAEKEQLTMVFSTFGLTHAAIYRLTTDDNALRKGWHMPLKTAGFGI
jgi:hypothetical protein